MNSHGYTQSKCSSLDKLLVGTAPLSQDKNASMKKAMVALSELGIQGMTPSTLMNRLTSSQGTWASESHLLDLFASSLGYLDIICMTIEYHFLDRFGALLEKELLHHLKIMEKSPMELEFLLREDPTIEEKRKKALERQMRLELVWKNLIEFSKI